MLFWIVRKSGARFQAQLDKVMANPKVKSAWEIVDRSAPLLDQRFEGSARGCCLLARRIGARRGTASGQRGTVALVAGPGLVERAMTNFLRKPISVRSAARVIVVVTVLVVVLGGILMRVLDGGEYPSVWLGMWFALQTVTTVGYGDATPENVSGRIVAVFLLLEGIAFLTIIVAAITSIFVTRAGREAALEDEGGTTSVQERFDDLDRRLDRLEALLKATREI